MKNNSLVICEKLNSTVLVLTLNRSDKKNALNIELLDALITSIKEAALDLKIRALIIRGNGSLFCSGLDLKEAIDESTTKISSSKFKELLLAIYQSPHVTIAAVHGAAIAGGAGLMSACDFVISSKNTIFGYPEVKRGLVASQVMVFLKKQIGERHVRELLLLGEYITSEKALSIGLINRVVDESELMIEAQSIASIISKNAPYAIKKTKEQLDSMTGILSQDLLRMQLEGEKIRDSKEAKEGMFAFLEKREPNWVNKKV